ncbi:hypothetical protein ABEB22_12515 [Thioclava sp. 'Guangxiensis']|uniref:hypothetical protein n=1 Tax=Thioclava sp. 'Guangxiensis' TaxID=3149044 RepID=UPI003877EC3A
MNFQEELLRVAKSRLLSPIYGNFIFLALALNWKPIVFLIFGDQPLEYRIFYFEKATEIHVIYGWALPSVVRCFVLPAMLTAFFYWLTPRLRNWFAEQNSEAERKGRANVLNVFREGEEARVRFEHKMNLMGLDNKEEIENKKLALEKIKSKAVLQGVEIDQDISKIEDVTLRESAHERMAKFREDIDKRVSMSDVFFLSNRLSDLAKYLLIQLAELDGAPATVVYGDKAIVLQTEGRHESLGPSTEKQSLMADIEVMASERLVTRQGRNVLMISDLGKNIAGVIARAGGIKKPNFRWDNT